MKILAYSDQDKDKLFVQIEHKGKEFVGWLE